MKNITTFISMYDNMLLGVAEGVENLDSQVEHTDGIRASVLSNNLIVGFFIAKVYSAIAMGERYLELRPWEEMPERIEEDEKNFGMIMHSINSWDFDSVRDKLMRLTNDIMPMEHESERLRDLEMELGQINSNSCDGKWIDTLPEMLNDLGLVLKMIYEAENPEYEEKGIVKAKIPQFDGFMELCPPSDKLVVQQALVIDNLPELVETTLREIGTWPMTIAQLELFAADMEEAHRTIKRYDCSDFEEGYLDLAIGKCEDAMGDFVKVLDRVVGEYAKVANADEDKMEEAIGVSLFPLVAHSEAAIKGSIGLMFIFPRMMMAYKIMAQVYLDKIKKMERLSEN